MGNEYIGKKTSLAVLLTKKTCITVNFDWVTLDG